MDVTFAASIAVREERRQSLPPGVAALTRRARGRLGPGGSTLVSRLLAALPRHRVLSEPLTFNALLGEPGVPAGDRRRWLRQLLGAYARGMATGVPSGPARFLVKWDSPANQFIRLIEAE